MDNELNYAAEENDEEFEKALGFDAEEKETDE